MNGALLDLLQSPGALTPPMALLAILLAVSALGARQSLLIALFYFAFIMAAIILIDVIFRLVLDDLFTWFVAVTREIKV